MLSTKKLIATMAAGIVVAPGLVVYGATTAAQGAAKKPSAAEVNAGKALFAAHCASCHGMTGTGTAIAPSLKTLPRAKTVKGVVEQLTNPLQRSSGVKMTNFNHTFSKKQKEELGAYVTTDIVK